FAAKLVCVNSKFASAEDVFFTVVRKEQCLRWFSGNGNCPFINPSIGFHDTDLKRIYLLVKVIQDGAACREVLGVSGIRVGQEDQGITLQQASKQVLRDQQVTRKNRRPDLPEIIKIHLQSAMNSKVFVKLTGCDHAAFVASHKIPIQEDPPELV